MRRRSLAATLAAALIVPALPLSTAWAREQVAEVYGRAIYRDELAAPGQSLEQLVIWPLVQHFVAENGLAATDAEIEDFLAAKASTKGALAQRFEKLPDAERAEARKFLVGFVEQWKVSKALYQRYGGEVIFQQSNPLEPVGAMRQFLEDQEASGVFKIFDAAERERFYAYYRRRDHPGGFIPKDRVNYDVPWWRMKRR